MRVLYICRLYSGFEDSLRNQEWTPTGAPTIARMIETLDVDTDTNLTLVFTVKDFNCGWDKDQDETLEIQGLDTPIHVLAGERKFPTWCWKFREKFSDLRQVWQLYKLYRQHKPDFIYCDRVNVFPAAIFSRFTKTPVIWRVMGVLEDMHRDAMAPTLRAALKRMLWKSPFARVICTLDGSGGGPWMERVLNPHTKHHLLLNGMNFDLQPDTELNLPPASIDVLFAGRLESLKGAEEFLQTAIKLVQENPAYKVFFAGDGSLFSVLEKRIAAENLQDHIILLGQLAPAQMRAARQHCDIYVSLNKQGNLSNVNLEAMADGMVVIVPESCPNSGVDMDTDQIVPADVFYRFGHVDDQQTLLSALLYFADTDKQAQYKSRALEHAKKILPSWEERIAQERTIFDDLCNESK